MKHFTLLLALICICISANSQNIFYGAEAQSKVSAAQVVRMGTDPVYPTYIQFSFGKSIPMSEGEKFMIGNFKTNGEFGLQLLNVETDQNQITQHYRYIQTESGVPVAGSMWIIHVTHGMITSMNGQLYSNKVLSNATSVSETVALQNALNFIGASVYKWQIPTEETFIKNDMNDPNATFYPKAKLTWVPVGSGANSTLALAYAFDIYAQEPLSRTLVSVDANTGIVIGSNSLLEAIDVNGIAHTQYSGTQTIRTDSLSPTSFRLREAVRGIGNGIETYNMHAGTNYGAATDFTDADNDWNNINANLDEYATDAHYASEMVYDYYYNTYGRNSIDGLGFKLKSYVHYDVQYLNAFWDGTRMSYGDGSTGYTPLTSLDIGGHEITHGLTSFTANLNYSYESGALNESFSDVLGETIQGYGTNWGQDWLMSANIGVPFRSFIDPNLYGQPDTYLGTNWATGPGDNGGVHTNSGVQNFWYYLLVNGGTGTNDNNNAYNVSGIGIIKAAAIAFRTLTVYLTPTSQYADARFYSLQAATDLFGACSNEVVQTANAWYAVGVGGVFVPVTSAAFTAAQTSYCTAPADVQFTNQSTNGGTFTWDFGDGTTSNAVNPLHTYTNYNTYDVKLVADGNQLWH